MPSFFFLVICNWKNSNQYWWFTVWILPLWKKIFQGTMRNMNSHLHSPPCPTLNSQLVLVLLFGLIPVLTLLTKGSILKQPFGFPSRSHPSTKRGRSSQSVWYKRQWQVQPLPGNLSEMHIFKPRPRSLESELVGVGPRDLYFNQPSRRLECKLKLENSWHRGCPQSL